MLDRQVILEIYCISHTSPFFAILDRQSFVELIQGPRGFQGS